MNNPTFGTHSPAPPNNSLESLSAQHVTGAHIPVVQGAIIPLEDPHPYQMAIDVIVLVVGIAGLVRERSARPG